MAKKVIIFSAPSGAGKTTILRNILQQGFELEFSVSATSRQPREGEEDGKDYHFLSVEEFKSKIKNDEFLEWEEVYGGNFYGTLKREIDRIWAMGKNVIFDVDVYGGLNIKKYFGAQALSIFIMPPSVEVLEERLINRGTETYESLQKRVSKARQEIELAPRFDKIVVNDNLETATEQTKKEIKAFLSKE
jgi:guanylate kinase